jgi:uncharacterized protein (TIGR02231 family)
MKHTLRIALAVSFLLSFCGFVFAADVETESRIVSVTVYPDSALIIRSANLKLSPGEYKIIFSNIIPEVDENSLRVSAQDNAAFKLFGAQLKREYLEEVPSEKIKELQQQIQGIEDQIKAAQDLKTVLLEEKSFLDSIRVFSHDQIPKDLITRMPNVKDMDDTLKFLDIKLKENYSGVMDAELKARDLARKVEALRNELSQISGPVKKIKRSIVVDAEVLKSVNLDLLVSYLVRGAYWQPIYDARASFERNQVELVSYGIVRQTTGEDWQEVDISLSTARPSIGGRMPYVAPWFLRPYQPQAAWGGRKDKAMRKAAELSMVNQTAAFDSLEGNLEKEEAKTIYARPEEKGIAVVYNIARKATVRSDGSEHKLPVSSQMLQTKFEYSSYPRLAPCAYLGSRVTNADNLQLLAGRVNIFLENDFVGVSSIDGIGPQEEFDLYLGVDENVKVKREQISKKVDDVLIAGIPAPNRTTTFKYKISIENYKNKQINVILFEAMPVSEDERIKVKIHEVSVVPAVKDWKDRKGVWRFELGLAPREKKEITYTYTVEHPRDMQVEGL